MELVQVTGSQTCNIGKFSHQESAYAVDAVLNTDGSGYWSRARQSVRITHVSLPYVQTDDLGSDHFGELRVFFDTNTWQVTKQGLIYTDRKFIQELRDFLQSLGLAGSDVDYSEQGMQGDNYVSLDVGAEFIESWRKLGLMVET